MGKRSLLGEGAGGGDALAFRDGDGLARGDVLETVDLATGPANFDRVGLFLLSEAKGQDEFAGGEIARAAAEHLVLRFTARGELDHGANAVTVRFRTGEFNAQAAIRARTGSGFVEKKPGRAAIRGYRYAQPAAVVDIRVGCAAGHAR